MPSWFAIRTLSPGVHLIAEPFHVNSFLVEGSEYRVHVDTGLGVADIRAAGDALSPLTPHAANTHHHYDHVGGNDRFDEVAIHELGVALIAAGPEPSVIEAHRRWALEMARAWPTYRDLDDRFFALTDDVGALRPFPDGFDIESWTVRPSKATRSLRDGDVLDLGARRLRVIHTPGHTPDSVCYLDEEEGLLFAGDTVNSGPILLTDPIADLRDFARSVRRLADDVATSVRLVLMAHGARFTAAPGYLREVADGAERLVAGEVQPVGFHDELEGPARIGRFPRFSIVLPPADGPGEEQVGRRNGSTGDR